MMGNFPLVSDGKESMLFQTKKIGYTHDAEAGNGNLAALVEALRQEVAQVFSIPMPAQTRTPAKRWKSLPSVTR